MKFFNNKGKLYNNCYLAIPSIHPRRFADGIFYDVWEVEDHSPTCFLSLCSAEVIRKAFEGCRENIIWIS